MARSAAPRVEAGGLGKAGKGEVGMKTHVCLTAVVVALLGLGVVRGQGPRGAPVADAVLPPPVIANNADGHAPPSNEADRNDRPGTDVNEYPEGGPRPEGGQPSGAGGGPPVYGPGITDWIAYPRPCNCC